MKLRLLFVVLILSPLVFWFGYKPIRILAPELNGVDCVSATICIEASSKLDTASELYASAHAFTEKQVTSFENNPRVIFCSTPSCFNSFGFNQMRAATLSTFGIIIGPSAWDSSFLSHEFIHHLQHEKLGNLEVWFDTPQWFMEGMAYSLSDEREVLGEPWESYRDKFTHWSEGSNARNFWQSARSL
ncbi:hypothetical protein CWB96_08015 [Pseudoalteromonas citrea]|uniref:Uncharacterized protein n=1 Tax=Pseudoalteromonas citrea TaxID=43655 RepID=A0A5S3XSC4_9GAMM|nr:hypothetical protein [Pseudoalteromonas citrea]TMP41991.1 hypothetical protein CWB97_12840 [Pseudoalteromonas citrea]TMP59986.1 hypothetical protein CWB96_08015 [Pseudoalteromonas citrea]